MNFRTALVLFFVTSLILSGCGSSVFAAPEPTMANSPLPPPPPTLTATSTLTPTITPTFTPSPIPSPTLVAQGPGKIKVPILMYHRIDVSPIHSRYYVTPENFEAQIKLLHDWEYKTISIEMLLKAVNEGAELPPRPIIITFDDGNLDNYTTAFPIMQKYGFTGVLYLVGNYIGSEKYLDVEQIQEMAGAGWEVGSHSMNHKDLTKLSSNEQRFEIVTSREFLESKLGLPILTFAYPSGLMDDGAGSYVHFAEYIAAMGATGFTADQGPGNLFYLQRCEVKGSDTPASITRFLPWLGDLSFLQTSTPAIPSTP